MIQCSYHNDDSCQLKLHGGKPNKGNCRECILAGENNSEYAERLFAAFRKSHPPNQPQLHGCCDPPPPSP